MRCTRYKHTHNQRSGLAMLHLKLHLRQTCCRDILVVSNALMQVYLPTFQVKQSFPPLCVSLVPLKWSPVAQWRAVSLNRSCWVWSQKTASLIHWVDKLLQTPGPVCVCVCVCVSVVPQGYYTAGISDPLVQPWGVHCSMCLHFRVRVPLWRRGNCPWSSPESGMKWVSRIQCDRYGTTGRREGCESRTAYCTSCIIQYKPTGDGVNPLCRGQTGQRSNTINLEIFQINQTHL